MTGVIFDLDQTIIDSSSAEAERKNRNWAGVYQMIPNFILYDGMRQVLDWLQSEGFTICIVTSSPETYCKKVLSYWKIPYSHTVCYHDTRNRKPHPDPMHRALELMKLHSSKVLSLGDRDIDLLSSHSAGIQSVACLWGAEDTTTLLQANPTFTAKHPTEIQSIIKQAQK